MKDCRGKADTHTHTHIYDNEHAHTQTQCARKATLHTNWTQEQRWRTWLRMKPDHSAEYEGVTNKRRAG